MSKTSQNDRIAGVMVGQAVADALGMGYEFRPTVAPGEEIIMKSGALFPMGSWTDDTEQAIVVALAKANPAATAEGMLAWLHTHPRDVGRQTSVVLGGAWDATEVMRRSAAYGEYMTSKPARPGQKPGLANGSLMRTGPVALAYLDNSVGIAKAAREVSDVTHADPTGYTGDACVLWSLIISDAVVKGDGNFDLWQACQDAIGYIPAERRGFWANLAFTAINGPQPEGKNGAAVAAFAVALNAVARTHSYEEAVKTAIRAGHDTDTTAAIAGMLAGALYGMSGIPVLYRDIVHGQAGPYPGTMKSGDVADLALALAHGWAYNVPQYARDYPEPKQVSIYAK